MKISFGDPYETKGGSAMKVNIGRLATALIMLSVLGWNGLAQAGDVSIYLPDADSYFNVNQDAHYRFRVRGNGYVGIGTNAPSRYLHVKGDDNIAKFATSSAYSRALLDLDAPNILEDYFSRLCWRATNYSLEDRQFGAIDLVYVDLVKPENTHMAFSTMDAGTLTETMRLGYKRVGIGTTSPTYKLDVAENLLGHTGRFYNAYTGGSAGVLKLRVGTATPGTSNEFIRFEKGDGSEVGSITGNGGGGVTYHTSAADFAEYLPLKEPGEQVEAGDIVGLFGGTISRATLGTDRVRVISSAPALLGNTPPRDQIDRFRKVAFIGQVPVKVRGIVQEGDYVVPSGLHDGIGVAVAPEKLRPAQYGQIVGVASESSTEESVKLVVVEVGLHTAAKQLADLHEEKDRQLSELTQTTRALQARLEALEKAVSRINPEPSLVSLRRE